MTTKPPQTDEPNRGTSPAGETATAAPEASADRDAAGGIDPRTFYRRFAVHALVTVLALAALGFLPTRRLAGDAGLIGMVAALVADLAASTAGTLPIWWSRHRHPSQTVGAQLGAMGLRLAVVLALGLAIALSGLVPIPAFLVWLAIGHTGLLVADTIFARSLTAYAMQHTQLPNPSPARGPR